MTFRFPVGSRNCVLKYAPTSREAAALFLLALAALSFSPACSKDTPAATTKQTVTLDPDVFPTDHPELFQTAKAQTQSLPTQITANGTVSPDINRTIHVTSLGSGRVVDLKVKLGDQVKKGQSLLVISSPDLAAAMADFQKAQADEVLSRKALDRAKLLYERGAIATKDLETAQDLEDKAKVDVSTAEQHVRVLGADPLHPSSLIDLRAPVAGTIVEQNVAGYEGVKSLDNTVNLFTIADLSQVWVVCDVYQDMLPHVHVGDIANISVNGYAHDQFAGKVINISQVLDPTTRTAKVRIELPNPNGIMRAGMYVTAMFHAREQVERPVVPTTAIIQVHDSNWVFVPLGNGQFRRVHVELGPEVEGG